MAARPWADRAGPVDAPGPGKRVSVVIPTLNEAENLWSVLPELSSDYELVIVDGGSSDRTVDVALILRPDAVILRQPGRGKGNALLHGFAAASGQYIVAFDADGSARADEIPRFVEALADGADFAKGSRFVTGGGSSDLTLLRKFGNRFLCGVVNLLHGTLYTDLCYGFNAFRRSCLPFMPEHAPGFEIETVMNIRMAKARLRVVEIPSFEEPRRFGSSNLHAFRDGFKILSVLIRELFRSAGEAEPVHQPAGVVEQMEVEASGPRLVPRPAGASATGAMFMTGEATEVTMPSVGALEPLTPRGPWLHRLLRS